MFEHSGMMDVAASPPQVRRMRKSDVTRHRQARMFSALVVDDNFALRSAIARSLARDGWYVTTATDGLEALELVRTHQFDVVVTDVHMPRRGGLWLWEQALALRPELRGKFVFMSSEPLPEPPRDAVFMVKPLSLATLKSELQGIVRIPEGAKVLARESAIVQHTG
jgi:CheY-like chemotaxis protein